jgi:hypothetical protein
MGECNPLTANHRKQCRAKRLQHLFRPHVEAIVPGRKAISLVKACDLSRIDIPGASVAGQ